VSTSLGLPGKDLRRSRYRLLGLVGQGQFGRVYCAVHRRTGQLVALKDLDHERFPTHKFLRELRFLLSLEHPNIVTCYALEHTRTGRYLVMDYCEGGTLRGLMDEDTRLSLPQSIKITADVLSGLAQAHQRGIVHCDIKPENILLNLEPHGWKGRVSDFGIARLSQEIGAEPHSGTGNTGSPAYMAPERFYGQYSKTSDLYSVGVLLYELLSGDRPFSGTPGELMSAHLNKPLQFPNSIAAAWHPVLTMSLQKLAARRFSTADDMLAELKRAAEAEGILGCLERQPVSIPLLQPLTELPPASLAENRTDRIGYPIGAIAVLPEADQKLFKPFPSVLDLCIANGSELRLERRETSPTDAVPPLSSQTIQWPEPIRQLVPTVEGECYVLTDNAVYQVNGLRQGDLRGTTLTHLEPGAIAALAPDPSWLAIASPQTELSSWQLRLLSLRSHHPSPRLVSIPLANPQAQVKHLIALDQRHLVALSRCPEAEEEPSWMDVLTRRGKRVGRFALPIQVEQIQRSAFPYRLLASDRRDPQSLLVLDLKPYRINRFGLGIVPDLIAATPWGYVVADHQGKVLMLDEYGQRVGYLELPFSPTALVPFDAHGLLIATWNETWGQLHLLNLKTLDIQFLF